MPRSGCTAGASGRRRCATVRVLEDIGAIGDSVFRNPDFSAESRAAEVRIFAGFFTSGGMPDTVESA